jgi:hypothetical protein
MRDQPALDGDRDYDQRQYDGQRLDRPALIGEPAEQAVTGRRTAGNNQHADRQQHPVAHDRARADRLRMKRPEAVAIGRLPFANAVQHPRQEADQQQQGQHRADLGGSDWQQEQRGQQLDERERQPDRSRQPLGHAEAAGRLDRTVEVEKLANRGHREDGREGEASEEPHCIHAEVPVAVLRIGLHE